jgi:hypothetical protein
MVEKPSDKYIVEFIGDILTRFPALFIFSGAFDQQLVDALMGVI